MAQGFVLTTGIAEMLDSASDEGQDFILADLQVVGLNDQAVGEWGQHLRPRRLVVTRLTVFEEATLARARFDDALAFQLKVGFGDGIAIDAKFLGEGPDTGQRLAGLEGAGGGGGFDLIHDLRVHRLAEIELDLDPHRLRLVS